MTNLFLIFLLNCTCRYQESGNMSSGDWMCGSCQHLNFKKRDSCQCCRFPKFGGSADIASYGINKMDEVLADDWYYTAINYGAHNYASRTSCFRCSASDSSCHK